MPLTAPPAPPPRRRGAAAPVLDPADQGTAYGMELSLAAQQAKAAPESRAATTKPRSRAAGWLARWRRAR